MMTDRQRRKIRDLQTQGLSAAAIAARLMLSYQAVVAALAEVEAGGVVHHEGTKDTKGAVRPRRPAPERADDAMPGAAAPAHRPERTVCRAGAGTGPVSADVSSLTCAGGGDAVSGGLLSWEERAQLCMVERYDYPAAPFAKPSRRDGLADCSSLDEQASGKARTVVADGGAQNRELTRGERGGGRSALQSAGGQASTRDRAAVGPESCSTAASPRRDGRVLHQRTDLAGGGEPASGTFCPPPAEPPAAVAAPEAPPAAAPPAAAPPVVVPRPAFPPGRTPYRGEPPPAPSAVVSPREPAGCRYITGDVRRGDWAFCQAETQPGESWCAQHRAIVLRRATGREAAEQRAALRIGRSRHVA